MSSNTIDLEATAAVTVVLDLQDRNLEYERLRKLVKYVNANAYQVVEWISKDLCMWCGTPADPTDLRDCLCRRCDSCTSIWIADTRQDLSDGRPAWEDCPACLATAEDEDERCSECGHTAAAGARYFCKMD